MLLDFITFKNVFGRADCRMSKAYSFYLTTQKKYKEILKFVAITIPRIIQSERWPDDETSLSGSPKQKHNIVNN